MGPRNQRLKTGARPDTREKSSNENLKPQENDLPVWESIVTVATWISVIFYLGYCLYLDSYEIVKAGIYHFQPGSWPFRHRLRDCTNAEWEFWRDFWLHKIWCWVLGYLILCHVSRRLNAKYGSIVEVVYTLLVVWQLSSLPILLAVLAYILVAYFVAHTRQVLLVWALALAVLSAFNNDSCLKFVKSKLVGDEDIYEVKLYLLIYSLSMVILRAISFGCDCCMSPSLGQGPQKLQNGRTQSYPTDQNIRFDFLSFLHYCLYLPVFYSGPICNYVDFHKQWNEPVKPWTKDSVKSLLCLIVRVLISAALCEAMLHYMYFNFLHHADIINTVSMWSLCAVAYYHGQFFMMKYVVLYGIPKILAKIGGIEIADTPSCVGRIGTAVKYWRTFDRGLYQFLTRYIYIPAGGSRHGLLRQFLATLLCFTFVFVWHGATAAVFWWIFINFMDIILETVAFSFNSLDVIQDSQERYLSKAAVRRIKSLMKAPFIILTTIAVNTFFGGIKVGQTLARRILFEGFPGSVLLCTIFFYCLVQTDYIVSRLECRQRKTKID